MIKKIATLMFLIPIICQSSISDTYAQDINKKGYTKGSEQEISLQLNKSVFTKADEAILISEELATDAISATPLAYAKNAPIIVTEWRNLSDEIIDYLEELGVKKITIIGGLNLISKTTEKQLIGMGYEVNRVTGTGSYQRSRKIANLLGDEVDVKKAIVVSRKASATNGLAISSYAAQNNLAVILSDDLALNETASFINKKGYEEIYAIGYSPRFITAMTEKVNCDSTVIKEMDRDDMNIDIISDIYKDKYIDTIYTASVDYDNYGVYGVKSEYISLGVVSAINDVPVLLTTGGYSHKQEQFIEEKNIENIITVGNEVKEFKIGNILKNKYFISSVALIIFLLIMAVRVFKL